jgi:hypothetical protein
MGWILYHAQPPVSKAAKEMNYNALFMPKQCCPHEFCQSSVTRAPSAEFRPEGLKACSRRILCYVFRPL